MAEQANLILAAIDDLHAEIQQQVAHSSDPTKVIVECLVQMERLSQRLRETSSNQNMLNTVATGSQNRPRLRVGSPRLVNPNQAGDFVMDVAEEGLDAGL